MANLLDFALTMAQEAGAYTLDYYKSSHRAMDLTYKGDASPVTIADKGAERLMRSMIAKAYPDDGIVGEEEDNIKGSSGRTWYLDPIDGTKSFISGVPLYTNLVALWDEEGPLLGVINLPALGEIMWAQRGKGCFYKERGEVKQAWVSKTRTLDAPAYLLTSGVEWFDMEHMQAAIDARCIVRTWGDGYAYYQVAKGSADIAVDFGVSIWDVAPLSVIIREAGGQISGADQPNRVCNVLASNSVLHETACSMLGITPTIVPR